MDRHGDARADEGDGLGCAPRVEVALAERRPPAPDGEEGDVGVRRDLREGREEVCVAEEVEPLRAADDVAERLRRLAEEPRGFVFGVHRLDGQPADRELVSRADLGDRRRDAPPDERACPIRDDDRVNLETAQRAEVEVVVVDVGDEDGVEVVESLVVERLRAAEHDHAFAQQADR